MPHTDTRISQATNRPSCHVSHRYKQITGNKSYILPCLIQLPSNHRQQSIHLTMPHTDTRNSQATNRTSYHASHRYQQIIGNNSSLLPCLTQIQADHRQQIVHLTMPHTDTRISQATSRTSYHASHRNQQITGNKSYTLQCFIQIPENTGHLANKSYILPCLTQIPANHRQQTVHLTMPHTDTSISQATNRTSYYASHRYKQHTGNKSYILPCLTQIPEYHRQHIVHLAMSHTDTSKSQSTNRTSCHASYRYQQITGNKSCFLPCLTQIPENHKQQIVHLTMPHTDTSKSQATNRKSRHASHRYQQSQATNRTSYHASHRYQQITGNKSYILPRLTQIPANHRH